MEKEFDYKNLYRKHYKNIPNYYFIATLVTFLLGAVGTFIGFAIAEEFGIAFLCLIGGVAVGIGLAHLSRLIASIVISQSIVAADALLAVSEGASAPVADEELPEL